MSDWFPQAFCSVSTGIYGYPIKDATHVALDTVRNFLSSERGASVSLSELPGGRQHAF
jgi:O-acetyl-ADP-ribose deacetylase (regulator of RNase III)